MVHEEKIDLEKKVDIIWLESYWAASQLWPFSSNNDQKSIYICWYLFSWQFKVITLIDYSTRMTQRCITKYESNISMF